MKINPFIRILFCLALVLVTYSVSAQPGLAGTYWHDGEWFYPVEAEDEVQVKPARQSRRYPCMKEGAPFLG